MGKLFLILVLAFAATGYGRPASKFRCDNVGGTEEWTIYVDLIKKLAGFFDNDDMVIVPLKSAELLKSRPPQLVYTFQGKDRRGRGDVRITFNRTARAGWVTLGIGTRNEKILRALDGCVEDPTVDLKD